MNRLSIKKNFIFHLHLIQISVPIILLTIELVIIYHFFLFFYLIILLCWKKNLYFKMINLSSEIKIFIIYFRDFEFIIVINLNE